MSWLRRKAKGSEAPTVVNNYYGVGASPPPQLADADDGREAGPTRDELIEKAVHDIRLKTSAWSRFKRWMGELGWVTFLLGGISIVILPSEWYLTVLTVLVANALMYGYTKWVYKPPVVPVVQYDDEGGGGVLSAHLIPTAIWDSMVKEGLTNTIQTSHGPTYMVRSITWDAEQPGRIPVAVEFSWLHYNELNFATKREVFDEIRTELKVLREQNNRYKWLLDNMVLERALALVTRWIAIMSHGRFNPMARRDEAGLKRELLELERQTERNRIPPSADQALREVSGSGEEA